MNTYLLRSLTNAELAQHARRIAAVATDPASTVNRLQTLVLELASRIDHAGQRRSGMHAESNLAQIDDGVR